MILAHIGWLLFLKWFWTIAAGIGVLVTGALFFMSVGDYQFLVQNKLNGWRRNVAKTSMLIYFGGFGTQLVYFVVGVIALTLTTKLPKDYIIPARQWATTGLFVFGAISSIVLAIVIFYRRRNIIDIIEASIREQINKERDDENKNPSSD